MSGSWLHTSQIIFAKFTRFDRNEDPSGWPVVETLAWARTTGTGAHVVEFLYSPEEVRWFFAPTAEQTEKP